MKTSSKIAIAAAVVGAWLLAKKNTISGVGTTKDDALHRIYRNLLMERSYGYFSTFNNGERYIHDVLYLTDYGNIGWNHYGSSANKCTLKELKWIITKIFDTTPEEFEDRYVLNWFDDHKQYYINKATGEVLMLKDYTEFL